MGWTQTATLVAVLAPLVGIPLSAMTFYLRALRDGQQERLREANRRIEALERQARQLEQVIEEMARSDTTKEEWLRESMLARQQLQRLTELAARMQAQLEDGEGLMGHLLRASEAMTQLARQACADGAVTVWQGQLPAGQLAGGCSLPGRRNR